MTNAKYSSLKVTFRHLAMLCSRSEYCVYDIKRKLCNFGVEECDRETIIQKLIDEKFVDELRYCTAFVTDKIRNNKWGIRKIVNELQKKHIPSTIINEVIIKFSKDEIQDVLTQLLIKKQKLITGKNPSEINNKLMRFAYSRGFSSGEIEKAIETINNPSK
ncbi:MAG: RecX family transcriptional regulator [Dysgonamonadaceae bacterium]|jgi:regulatory protein|nr:RecX family transcriptional regulator [Dysgonamonadaceae bacterium]